MTATWCTPCMPMRSLRLVPADVPGTDVLTRVDMRLDARLEPCTMDSSTMPECAASPEAWTTKRDPPARGRAPDAPGVRRAAGRRESAGVDLVVPLSSPEEATRASACM